MDQEQPFGAPPGGAATPGRPLSSDEKLWVVIAHLGPIFFAFIPPLVVWLVKKDDSEFIGDQAKESLNFQITVFLAMIVGSLLIFVGIGLCVLPVIGIADLVLCIIATVKSTDGQRYRYPATVGVTEPGSSPHTWLGPRYGAER